MASAHTIQMLGLIGAASYLVARLASRWRKAGFHRYALVAQPRAALPAMPRGFTVRALSADDLAGHAVDASAGVQARRFADGLTCLGAFNARQTLTGLIWLREDHYDEDEVSVRLILPPGCCWDTGLWIAPEHRMGRTFAALWAGAAAWMDARGLTHSLSRISDYNLTALRAHQRMGAKVLGYRLFVRWGDWQWSAGTAPRLIRLSRGQRPRLDLSGRLIAGLVTASSKVDGALLTFREA